MRVCVYVCVCVHTFSCVCLCVRSGTCMCVYTTFYGKNVFRDELLLFRLITCFVLRHINLIGYLMPNRVKENKF